MQLMSVWEGKCFSPLVLQNVFQVWWLWCQSCTKVSTGCRWWWDTQLTAVCEALLAGLCTGFWEPCVDTAGKTDEHRSSQESKDITFEEEQLLSTFTFRKECCWPNNILVFQHAPIGNVSWVSLFCASSQEQMSFWTQKLNDRHLMIAVIWAYLSLKCYNDKGSLC